MNIFRKFTVRTLKKNRTRTLVTIIGIALSMSLCTAVIEGAYSGLQFLIRAEIERSGAFHGFYYDISKEQAQSVLDTPDVKDAATWHEVGWALIDSQNEYKPYLRIESASPGFTDFVPVKLTAGRMPENESEIILPDILRTNGGVALDIGDTLTVSVGRRMSGDRELFGHNSFDPSAGEEIKDTVEKTYSVVGIYTRFSTEVDGYSCPGYTALTAGDAGGHCHVFFTLKNPANFYDFLENQRISENLSYHRDLLMLYGSIRNSNLASFLYGFAGVLIFMIAFGSISLIYNSFSISVSERTRQFGILKSVGATNRQLHSSVIFEALVLSAIGIPAGLVVGCAGIGITLYCLRNSFSMLLDPGSQIQMRLVLSPTALIAAAAVCFLTTFISALIPARRAMSVSAIDAIRQTRDLKVKSRSVKTSALTKKLFGFEGMMASKNFKRNRKGYRSTVLSLFLSVTLFVSASSFCAYLTDTVDSVSPDDAHTDIQYSSYGFDPNGPSPDEVFTLLSGAVGVNKSQYLYYDYSVLYADKSDVDGSVFSNNISDYFQKDGDRVGFDSRVAFVSDESFRAICDRNGIDSSRYFDKDHPLALFYNSGVIIYQEGDSNRWVSFSAIKQSSIPCSLRLRKVKELEGYEFYDIRSDGGELFGYYYPEGYISNFYKNHDNDETLDESAALKVPESELWIYGGVTVGDTVRETAFGLSDRSLAAIYPYGMMEAAIKESGGIVSTEKLIFSFNSDNHSKTFDEMKKILNDKGLDSGNLNDLAAQHESVRTLVTVVNVFAYGFIIIISLIALANVFNTISTNIALRRREFAMLKSIGLSNRGFLKMMNYECVIYGVKGLALGLPASIVMTYLIFKITSGTYSGGFYIPWYSMVIAVGSVFAVVFAAMLYMTGKIKKDNPIDALKNENL